MIHYYLKTLKNFVRHIFYDRFRVVRIPFYRDFKFSLSAQFPVDHLPHLVASSLILSMCSFAWFAYLIDHFVSIITLKHQLFLRIVYFYFDIVNPYDVHLCCFQKRFTLSLKVSLSHVQVFPPKASLFCRLKCLYSCFSARFFLVIFILLMLMLSVLFLAAVISRPQRIFMYCSSRCIDASTLASHFPPFFNAYSVYVILVI